MSHTKGKLQYRKNPWDEGKYDLRPDDSTPWAYAPVAHVKGDKRVTGGNGEANARRLAACWNACDGLPQDALDGGWTALGLSQHAKQLEDENVALKAEVKRLQEMLENFTSSAYWRLKDLEADALKVENEKLRKDAERYRWLRVADATMIKSLADEEGMTPEGEEFDEAIDAAMKEGK